MGKKQLIWLSMLVLLSGITVLVYAQDMGTHSTAFRSGYDQGYPRGFEQGRFDHSSGMEFNVKDKHDYKNPEDVAYSPAFGDEGEFKDGFRSGFELGYQDGFTGKEAQIAVAPPLPVLEPPMAAEVTPYPEQEILPPAEIARAEIPAGTTTYRMGWDTGYRAGYEDGKADYSRGAEFDADDAPNSEGYRSTYNSSMGKRSEYKDGFKDGFELGYQDGYTGVTSRLVAPAEPQAMVEPQPLPPAPVVEEPFEEPLIGETTEPQALPRAEPRYEHRALPETLPRTASGLPLLGLIGLAGIGFSFLLRARRR